MKTYTWNSIYKDYVIYEDNDILGINKPAGISVMWDRNKVDIVSLAQSQNIHLFPVHRIDKETSGFIVFAKNPEARLSVTRQFSKHLVQKKYLAIVRFGDLPNEGTIDLPLSEGRKKKIRIAAKKEHIIFDNTTNSWFTKNSNIFSDKKNYPSKTNIKSIYQDDIYLLLSVNPVTGRTHQIRVHLAWVGFPIVGDPLFEKQNTFQRMYLHSYSLTFIHPTLHKEIILKAPPEKSFFILLEKCQLSSDYLNWI